MTSYFRRLDERRFGPTPHVGGAWATDEQHVAPALGLLAHAVEVDRDARRDDGLVLARLSYDILGTLPLEEVEVAVEVLRPGRTIELVEAVLSHDGRSAVRLRAWLMQQRDTAAIAGSGLGTIPGPDECEPFEASAVWPGGFIAAAEVRRRLLAPGRASYWVRSDLALLEGEPVGPVAHAARLLDIANGMAVRHDPREVAFPNVDLTAHVVRQPGGEWLGFDTTVTFGPDGLGVTSSRLHDDRGPFGTLAQLLTVRPT